MKEKQKSLKSLDRHLSIVDNFSEIFLRQTRPRGKINTGINVICDAENSVRESYWNLCSRRLLVSNFRLAGPSRSRLLSLTVPFHHLARLTHKCAINVPDGGNARVIPRPRIRAALNRIYIIGVTNLQELGATSTWNHRATSFSIDAFTWCRN